MKGLTREKMRYKVPGVCNRFLQVHKSVIFLCLFLSVSVVLLTMLAVRFHQILVFQEKPVLFVCCPMISEEEAEDARTQYEEEYSAVIFLRYDGFEAKEGAPSKTTVELDGVLYDIGGYFSAMDMWNVAPEKCVCMIFRSDKAALYSFATYADASIEEPRPLTAKELRTAIANASISKEGE